MTILNFEIEVPICLATLKTWVKSAALVFFFVGVPTHIKTISEFDTYSLRFVENFSLRFW